MAEVRNMAQAAKVAGLKHAASGQRSKDTRKWVPLSDNRMPTLQGKYKVPHFDGKGESQRLLYQNAGVPTTPAADGLLLGQLYSLRHGAEQGSRRQAGDHLPARRYAGRCQGIAAEDIGACAYGIFKRGGEFIGKTVGVCTSERLFFRRVPRQMAAAFAEVLGRPVAYNSIEPDAYRALGFPGAEDLGSMFQFKRDFEGYYCRGA